MRGASWTHRPEPCNRRCLALIGRTRAEAELGNNYHTAHGNASLPCGVTVADAAARAAAAGGGPELGSAGLPLPSDAQLVAFAKQTLGM